MTELLKLEERARRVRKDILDMAYNASDSHIGCAMSVVEILVGLYFKVMNINPNDPRWQERDRFVLSKGHVASALYSVLSEREFFPKNFLSEFARNGSFLSSHVDGSALPGVETSGGSGGHGLSLGAGMALAAKMDNSKRRIFVLCGDGELQEGSVWEAAMFAASRKLNNLTLVIDRNHYQTWDDVDNVVSPEPLDKKFDAFGWETERVEGHRFVALCHVLSRYTDRPHAVIAETVKGKGISFMENKGEWHNGVLTKEQYEAAVKEVSY